MQHYFVSRNTNTVFNPNNLYHMLIITVTVALLCIIVDCECVTSLQLETAEGTYLWGYLLP